MHPMVSELCWIQKLILIKNLAENHFCTRLNSETIGCMVPKLALNVYLTRHQVNTKFSPNWRLFYFWCFFYFVLHCMGLNYVKCANNFSSRWILEDFGYVTVYKIALLLIPKLSLYQFFLARLYNPWSETWVEISQSL